MFLALPLSKLHFDFWQVVKKAYFIDKSVVTKESFADLVTETDQAVERMIIDQLATKYPTHK